jgi:beta-lactamase regulating signal transducer with metallopeptidase domain
MTVLESLLRSSLQGALFIVAVWLVCRLFPRLPAAARCGLWWAACLKLLVGVVWISPMEIPLLPAAPDSKAALQRAVSAAGALTSPAFLSHTSPTLSPSPGVVGREGAGEGPGVRVREGARNWGAAALILLWLAGLAWQTAKAWRQLRYTRGVIARSRPLQEAGIRAVFAELCARLALRRQPDLRGSQEVRTPQAIGLLRPRVLLPEPGLERLSPSELSMTLCHELVHLRRGDLWLGWVPALAHRIFFFHPLAALAAREYAVAREAACDAEVLRVLGSAPQAYGRLLLRWGVAPRETGLAAAGASPSLRNLKRRLQMLQQTSDSRRRLSGWWWLAGAAVLAVALIPLRIVAQEPAPEARAEPAPLAAETEAPAVLAEGIPDGVVGGVVGGVEGAISGGVVGGVQGGVLGGVQGGVAGGVAGGVQGGVVGGVQGVLAMASPASEKSGYSYSWRSDDDGDAWVLLYGDHTSAHIHGSMNVLDKAKRLRGNSREPILWYRHDGKEYVVRDPALLRQAQEILRPQMELGARQGELGSQQGALGAQQGALGAQQGELGGRQGALGARRAALAADRLRYDDDADLEDQKRELEEEMEELGRRQEELGRQQEALGRQQEELGRRQEELGRQQEAAGEKAERELHALMDQAIRSGAAQEVQ